MAFVTPRTLGRRTPFLPTVCLLLAFGFGAVGFAGARREHQDAAEAVLSSEDEAPRGDGRAVRFNDEAGMSTAEVLASRKQEWDVDQASAPARQMIRLLNKKYKAATGTVMAAPDQTPLACLAENVGSGLNMKMSLYLKESKSWTDPAKSAFFTLQEVEAKMNEGGGKFLLLEIDDLWTTYMYSTGDSGMVINAQLAGRTPIKRAAGGEEINVAAEPEKVVDNLLKAIGAMTPAVWVEGRQSWKVEFHQGEDDIRIVWKKHMYGQTYSTEDELTLKKSDVLPKITEGGGKSLTFEKAQYGDTYRVTYTYAVGPEGEVTVYAYEFGLVSEP